MKTNKIRNLFLDFFQKNNHKILPSAPLINKESNPMFAIAGMIQFKDYLLQPKTSPYSCYATCQKCLRAGGKHNDLSEVGKTGRHHTFFEMLGNFSIYSYGRKEAISLAVDFLINVLLLNRQKMKITVHPKDTETSKIWHDLGFSTNSDEQNFWSQGQEGPCGYCTEIYYERHKDKQFIEIWNIVFVEYNLNSFCQLESLGHICVDTGMGLERLSTVMQGVSDNFDIDIFKDIRKGIVSRYPNITNEKLISDHIRSIFLLMQENLQPGNKGKQYVLRKIIRNAILNSSMHHPFIYSLKDLLSSEYDLSNVDLDLLHQEEKSFFDLINNSKKLLDKFFKNKVQLLEQDIKYLYDTHGIPEEIVYRFCLKNNLIKK